MEKKRIKRRAKRNTNQRDWFNQYSICLRYETMIVENSVMLKELITVIRTVLNIICMSALNIFFHVYPHSPGFYTYNFSQTSKLNHKCIWKTLNQMVKINVETCFSFCVFLLLLWSRTFCKKIRLFLSLFRFFFYFLVLNRNCSYPFKSVTSKV